MRDAHDPRGLGVLVAVGDLVEDVIVWHETPTRYATDNPCAIRRSRGGSAANVAVFASGLMPARFIGCVGDDPVADLLTSELAGHGVDVRVQRRGRTGTIVVLVDSGGERTMYPDRAAAADLSEVPDAWLESAAMIHVPSYCFAAEPTATSVLRIIRHAERAEIPVSLDASSRGMIEEYGLRRYLDLVESVRPSVFFANAHEAQLLDVTRPQFAETITVVKNGAEPTIVTVPGDVPRNVPVPEAPPARDSTGAGDAFAAGFLAARLRGADPVEAAAAGHETARCVLFSPGATSMPPVTAEAAQVLRAADLVTSCANQPVTAGWLGCHDQNRREGRPGGWTGRTRRKRSRASTRARRTSRAYMTTGWAARTTSQPTGQPQSRSSPRSLMCWSASAPSGRSSPGP